MARISRLLGGATATLALAVLLGACATPFEEPTVAPTVSEPTPTGTTDAGQAAFEAAEATYRAYIDAQNAVDFADPATFEDVYRLLTDPMLGVDRKSLTEGSAEGLTVSGDFETVWIEDAREDINTVDPVYLDVCMNVEAVEVLNPSGESIVSPDRSKHVVYRVGLIADSDAELGYLLGSREVLRGGDTC